MVKTSEAHEDGAGGRGQDGQGQDGRSHNGRSHDGRAHRRNDDGGGGPIGEAEHLQQDFARVRAKVATDPALAPRSLSAAWTTDVMEEDEAEFVDAVADCLGAGFSLDSALTGWDMGTLIADGSGEGGSLFDEDPEREDEAPPGLAFAARHTPTGGRRFLVT